MSGSGPGLAPGDSSTGQRRSPSVTLTIGGKPVLATPGTIVRMPAGVPHAVDAREPARMLLVMLRDPKDG